MLFLRVDPSILLGGGQAPAPSSQQQPQQGAVLEECQTGADANENDDCLVQATVESADSLWAGQAKEAGFQFQEPQAVVFTDSVNTGCGPATSATGPFYCPADSTIYVDTSFYEQLSSRFGASSGQLAKAYVVAHEYGHHIQKLSLIHI